MKHQTDWFKEITEASGVMGIPDNRYFFKWLVTTNNRTETYTNYFNNYIHGKKKNTPDKREKDKIATPEIEIISGV